MRTGIRVADRSSHDRDGADSACAATETHPWARSASGRRRVRGMFRSYRAGGGRRLG